MIFKCSQISGSMLDTFRLFQNSDLHGRAFMCCSSSTCCKTAALSVFNKASETACCSRWLRQCFKHLKQLRSNCLNHVLHLVDGAHPNLLLDCRKSVRAVSQTVPRSKLVFVWAQWASYCAMNLIEDDEQLYELDETVVSMTEESLLFWLPKFIAEVQWRPLPSK